jgi:hypothetical protein
VKKQSYKVLWNVFLMVICGGSLIYGFVQHQRAVESRVKSEQLEQRIDSIQQEANARLEFALKQLQIEKNNAVEALRE